MKRNFLLVALMSIVSCALYAQEVRVNAYTGYTFNDNIDSYYSYTDYYNGTIKGSFRWGGGIEYILPSSTGVELSYLRQDTKAPINYYYQTEKRTEFDVAINWVTVAGTHYVKLNEYVEPYGGINIGMGIFDINNPENNNHTSGTRFAWGLKVGTNIFFSRSVGIKLQADLMSAVQGAGGGLYFGTGGSGAAVSTYSTMLQFNLGGGLVFRFAPKSESTQQTRTVF